MKRNEVASYEVQGGGIVRIMWYGSGVYPGSVQLHWALVMLEKATLPAALRAQHSTAQHHACCVRQASQG